MNRKKLDDKRDITSCGFVIQTAVGTGGSKPVGTAWQPAPNSRGYCSIKLGGKKRKLHRLIWEAFVGLIPAGYQIDHVDGCKANNDISNLRLVTAKGNCRAFRRKAFGASSKYRGCSWVKARKKWTASIYKNGKVHQLGVFIQEEDAAIAYNNKAIELGFFPEALNVIAFNKFLK
jgi:hypothetical protein